MTAYLALLLFIAFMVGTPGPANLVVMLAGVTQGLQGCKGFISGLIVGKIGLNLFVGLGFGVAFCQPASTSVHLCQRMLWFCWRFDHGPARSICQNQHHNSAVKFRFRDGVIVHPLNPKAWVMVVLAWGNFAPALGDFSLQLLVVITGFATFQLVFHSMWCALGAYLGKSFAYNQRLTKLMIMLTILVVLGTLGYAPPT